MAKNFLQLGHVMDYTNQGRALTSGDTVMVGDRIGVALNNIGNKKNGSVQVEGVFDLAKKAADELAQGALVYWDTKAKHITATAAQNKLAGYAFVTAKAGDLTVSVKLNG